MSKTIENNVVQMSFDNKDFEKNISTSTKSIENLNEQLKFKDASKGFEDLEKYANSINFDGLNKAISNINSVFTVTGNLTKKIIDDIAGYFEKKILGAISAVKNNVNTILNIDEGIRKYEQFTTAMSSLRNNLSDFDVIGVNKLLDEGSITSDLDYIETRMNKIMQFSDETSYSFNEMVNTVAKFSASNVGLDEASSAMMGLANAAAAAGQNSAVATQSMQQVSQAFGVGYIKYQDWMQAFTSKNIATKQLKQTLVDAAIEAGTLDQSDIAYAKSKMGDGWLNYFFTSDTLNKGWLTTSEVFVKGMQNYSKASDEIFRSVNAVDEAYSVSELTTWAEKINKIAKNGGDVEAYIANLISGLGLESDEAEELAKTLRTLSDESYTLGIKAFLASQQATNFHEAIDAVADAVSTKFLAIFKSFIGDLDQARVLWTDFSNALWGIFAGPLDATLKGLETWNKELTDVTDETGEFLTMYDIFWQSVGRIFTSVEDFFGGFIDQIRIMFGAIEEAEDGTIHTVSIIKKYTLGFMEKLTWGAKKVADAMEAFLDTDFYNNVVKSFFNILKAVNALKTTIVKFVGSTLMVVLKNLGGPLTIISELVVELTERFSAFLERVASSDRFNKLMEAIGRLTSKLMELVSKVLEKLSGVILKIGDKIGTVLGKITNFLMPIIDWLIDSIDKYLIPAIDSLIEGPYSIGAAIDWLGAQLDSVTQKVKDFMYEITGLTFDEATAKVEGFTKDLGKNIKDIGGPLFDILVGFVKDSFNPNTAGTLGALFDTITEANSLAEGAQGTIKWTADALMRPIDLVLQLAGALLGKDLSGLSNAISDFIHSFTDTLADMAPGVIENVKKIGEVILGVLKYVIDLVIQIMKYALGMSDTTGFGVLDDVIFSIKVILSSLLDAFVFLLTKVAELAKYLTPAIEKVIYLLAEVIKALVDMVTNMLTDLSKMNSPKEVLSYLWDIAKMIIGFVLLMKFLTLIFGVVKIVSKVKGAAALLSDGMFGLSSSLSGLIDSLAGNSLAGMIRVIAFAMISFGYALSKIVAAGQALQDEGVKEGMMTAMGFMIVLIMTFVVAVKMLINTQLKAYNDLIKATKAKEKAQKKLDKLNKKHDGNGMDFLSKRHKKALGVDTDSMKNNAKDIKQTYSGIMGMLIGMGVAMIGIASAISILAKASSKTSPSDMLAAGAAIAIMIGVLTLFIKFTKVHQEKKSSYFKSGSTLNKTKSEVGDTFKGIAGVLLALAAAALIISIPLALLAHTANSMDFGKFAAGFGALFLIMGLMGAIMVLMTKFSKDSSFSEAASIVLIFNALTLMIVSIGIMLAGLAVVISQFADKDDYGVILGLAGILVGGLVAIGIIITVLVKVLQKEKMGTWQEELSKVAKMFIKYLFFTALFTSAAIFIAAITGSLISLAGAVKLFTNNDGEWYDLPYELLTAFGMITLIIFGLGLLIKQAAKASTGTGKGKTAIAKIGGTAIVMVAAALVLMTITKAIMLLATTTALLDYGVMWNAVAMILVISAIIAGIMYGMYKISKSLTGGEKGASPATEMLKLAGAMIVMATALTSVSLGIIAIAYASKGLDAEDLLKTLAVLVLAGSTLLLLAYAAKVLASGLKALTVAAVALLIVIAGGLLVIGLAMLFGEQVVDWMSENQHLIVRFFAAISEAFLDAIIGLLEGLVDKAPVLIATIFELLIAVLRGVAEAMSNPEFGYVLGEFIASFVKALVRAILVAAATLALDIWNAIWEIVSDIWNRLMEFLGIRSPSTKMAEVGEYLLEGLLNGLNKLKDKVIGFFENLWNSIRSSADNFWSDLLGDPTVTHVNETFEEVDRTKAKEVVRATQEYLNAVKQLNSGNISTSERINLQNKMETNASYLKKRASQYSAELKKLGYNTSAGFLEGLAAGGDPETLGRTYMNEFIDGGKKAADIHSPSGVMEWIGEMMVKGLQSGFNEEAGSNIGAGLAQSLTGGFSDKISGLTGLVSGEGVNLGSLFGNSFTSGLDGAMDISGVMSAGVDESLLNADMLGSVEMNVSDFSMDSSSYGFDNMNMDMDSLSSYGGLYDSNYDMNLDSSTSWKTAQDSYDAVEASNTEVVNQLKELNNKMAEYTESLRNIQMYLDTGVLVGELVAPIDKELGKKSSLKANRGV